MGTRAGRSSSRSGTIDSLCIQVLICYCASDQCRLVKTSQSNNLGASKIVKPPTSNSGQADTPAISPTVPSSEQTITVGLVQQFVDMLKVTLAAQAIPATPPQAAECQAAEHAQPEEARARASRLEFKTVDEMYVPGEVQAQPVKLTLYSWDARAYKYKIVESSTPTSEMDGLDEYIFVDRTRIGKQKAPQRRLLLIVRGLNKTTGDPTHFIDIVSEALRDTLRTVLQNVNGICLREDRPTVYQPLTCPAGSSSSVGY